MSAVTSVWRPYQSALPTQFSYLPLDSVRKNLFAISLSTVSMLPYPPSIPRGWSFETSVARGEASPGTAAAPARTYLAKGAGNAGLWVRGAHTYNAGGLPIRSIFYYSSDNEATYVPMLDEDGNYVLRIFHSATSFPQSAVWGNDETVSGN